MPHLSNAPGGPENQTTAYKAAKLAVIILSTLIILALIALVVGGIRTMRAKPAASSGDSATVQLPPGAQILEMQTQPGRLILRIRDGGAEEVRIIDIQNGRLVGQVKATFDPAR